eukprot:CAMPEP_0196587028 /NCGR_PEP_ID=MMETSP1081-20130531/56200_1 /TAXON_ID=36882 /ORGANISM="Pyramimonas amylifera, Strain CCMP720" /LENGTH=53 /DNA_ID=CAMNT_0041909083 /DNA_START=60 /DNA_END=221 /DNA_ORIENTATION=-
MTLNTTHSSEPTTTALADFFRAETRDTTTTCRPLYLPTSLSGLSALSARSGVT